MSPIQSSQEDISKDDIISFFGTEYSSLFSPNPSEQCLPRCKELHRITVAVLENFKECFRHGYKRQVESILLKLSDSENFEKLWGFSRDHLQLNNENTQDIVKNNLKEMFKVVERLSKKLKKIKKKLGGRGDRTGTIQQELPGDTTETIQQDDSKTVRFDFEVHDLGPLHSYLENAKDIQNSREMRVLVDKLSDINFKRKNTGELSPREYSPFVFVCASSGTGKTNMALSFKVPFLYFLLNRNTRQWIYDCFHDQSLFLTQVVVHDLEDFTGEVNFDYVLPKESLKRFHTVGYLVALIQKVVEKYGETKQELYSPTIQATVDTISFKPLTIEQGKAILEQLLGKSYIFPVVIDECAINHNLLDPKVYNFGPIKAWVRRFCFTEGIIRCLSCIPIFMATNTQALNILGSSVGTGSGGEEAGLLWTRPPGIAERSLLRMVDLLLPKMKAWRETTKASYPSEGVLHFLKKHLLKERPLFTEYAIDYLEYFFLKLYSTDSDEAFLALLFEDILDQFRNRKTHEEVMNLAQLSYISFCAWCIGDSLILRHLGFLNILPDDPQFPKYATLATGYDHESKPLQIYLKSGKNLNISTIFETFEEAPITGLICTGLNAHNRFVLSKVSKAFGEVNEAKRGKSFDFRISVVASIKQLLSSKGKGLKSGSKSSGFILELTLYCASILASRANGLKGCSLSKYIDHIVRELDYKARYGDYSEPSSVSLDPAFAARFSGVHIPFIAPMATKWNQEFVRDLEVLVPDMRLGTSSAHVHYSSCDFEVLSWPDEHTILAGECKIYEKNVDSAILKRIVHGKFCKYSCSLFLVCAPKFSKFRTLNLPEYCLWKLERQDGALKQIPIPTEVPQDLSAPRHILLLDLSIINNYVPRDRSKETYAPIDEFEETMRSFSKS